MKPAYKTSFIICLRKWLLALPAVALMLAACNSSSEPEYVVPLPETSTAVKSFSLKSDSKVIANLDSVFFSIDLNAGVIFNADSLPKGTKIDKLVPSITFATSVSAATIHVTGGTIMADSTLNFMEHPGDSIDFTGNVTLNVTAADGNTRRSYTLKVNVHKEVPDSLVWDKMAVTALPSRMQAPRQQKTVTFRGKAVALIEENDGSLTLSESSDLLGNEWEKTPLAPGFNPAIRSLAATDDALYVLDADNGELMTSADGMTWSDTGRAWEAILGGYGPHLLGLYTDGGRRMHGVYPPSGIVKEAEADSSFPTDGWSNLGTIQSKWSQVPTAMIFGGRKADGSLSDDTWGFDGNSWTVISNSDPAPLAGATIVPYYVYRKTSTSWKQTEFAAWLLIGGKTAEGKANRTVYMTYDNGVNWRQADSLMQMPDYIPGMWNLDNVVMSSPRSADISDSWKTRATRRLAPWMKINYDIDGYIINWDCPYIYLFGGENPEDSDHTYDTIWRGVLARMTFAPLI